MVAEDCFRHKNLFGLIQLGQLKYGRAPSIPNSQRIERDLIQVEKLSRARLGQARQSGSGHVSPTVSDVALTPWRDNSKEAVHRSGSVYGR